MAKESRHDMLTDTVDHHCHETEQVHVHVCRAIDDPDWMHGHSYAERNTKAEPYQRGLDETTNEPIHHSASTRGFSRSDPINARARPRGDPSSRARRGDRTGSSTCLPRS